MQLGLYESVYGRQQTMHELRGRIDVRWEDFDDLDLCVLQLRIKRQSEAVKGGLGGAIVGAPRPRNDGKPGGDGYHERRPALLLYIYVKAC